jgi:hypothetical protein
MHTKQLLIDSIIKKYSNVEELIKDIVENEVHILWIFAKDYAEEILKKDANWKWLSYRVFDFSSIVIDKMQKDLNTFIYFSFIFKNNKLAKYKEANDIKKAVKWLLNRFVNDMKNLFDKRSSNSINFSTLVNIEKLTI